jgi:UDP-N-acetylmuramoyl-L-alanyl-D-glutamate--2,6-diaminopimelate ligase
LNSFGMTTPDAISLQAMLAQFRASGITKVAVEASSIGLDQGRLDGARVVAAVFTNLTHDHLDYHGTMAQYAQAKAMLFSREHLRAVIVNGDDPASAAMLAACQNGASAATAVRVAFRSDLTRSPLPVAAQLLAEAITLRANGMTLRLGGDFGNATIELALLGRFNASNVLAVMSTWLALGMSFKQACDLALQLRPVLGRMEIVTPLDGHVEGQPLVVVDYAHTPDALENALRTLKPVADARGGALWCVFGAGGDRDPSKRPIMGAIAEQFAHHLVITSDNPRGESPIKIIADIRAGLTREPALTEADRELAIKQALRQAQPTDVVLIAGKGHEDYQEVGDRKLPFSDVDVARDGLRARGEYQHA